MLETVVGVRSQGELLQDTEDISLPIWKNDKKFHPPSWRNISKQLSCVTSPSVDGNMSTMNGNTGAVVSLALHCQLTARRFGFDSGAFQCGV